MAISYRDKVSRAKLEEQGLVRTLTDSIPSSRADFYELPTTLLRAALKHLSTQGKAQIFAGTEAGDGEGVKFV